MGGSNRKAKEVTQRGTAMSANMPDQCAEHTDEPPEPETNLGSHCNSPFLVPFDWLMGRIHRRPCHDS